MTDSITLRGENGALLTVSLPLHFSIQSRFDKGELTEVDPDGSTRLEYVPPPEPGEPVLPKRAAPHTEWAAYAVTQGMDPAEAAGMKRDELYMRYRRAS